MRVSYSQIQTYDRCGYKHHLMYDLGYYPKDKPEYFEVGTLVHKLMEIHYGLRAKGIDDTRDAALDYIDSITQANLDGLSGFGLESISTSIRIFDRYLQYAKEADADWEIVNVEVKLEVPMVTPAGTEFTLVGIPDLLIRKEGKLWLLDHKTTGKAAKFWSDAEVLMDSQTPLYESALRSIGFDIFGIIIQQINTYPYKKMDEQETSKLFKRTTSYRTPVELDNIVKEVYKVADELNLDRVIRKSLRRDCERCIYMDACLMSLKGIDPTDHLDFHFDRKAVT